MYCFTSESSTSGFLFPALDLTNIGLDPQNDIEGVFSGGHDASVIAVYNGDADVGLSFDDARREIRDERVLDFDTDSRRIVVFDRVAGFGWH